MATTVTAQEYQRNIGEYQELARREPVEVTRHGRRTLVVMSSEHYDWLRAVAQRSFRTEDAPDFVVRAIRNAKHPHEVRHKRKKPAK